MFFSTFSISWSSSCFHQLTVIWTTSGMIRGTLVYRSICRIPWVQEEFRRLMWSFSYCVCGWQDVNVPFENVPSLQSEHTVSDNAVPAQTQSRDMLKPVQYTCYEVVTVLSGIITAFQYFHFLFVIMTERHVPTRLLNELTTVWIFCQTVSHG